RAKEDLEIDLESELMGELNGMMASGPHEEGERARDEDEAAIAEGLEPVLASPSPDAWSEEALPQEEPSVPPDLESQLQALLAELGGNDNDEEDAAAAAPVEDIDFGEPGQVPMAELAEPEESW